MPNDQLEAHRSMVRTPSGDLSYVDAGEGPLTLFIHGVGTSAHFWRNLIGEFAGARRCVALDLPLHGHSPARPNQGLSIGALADVVEAFCEALTLTDVDLVAHDTGGAVAQVFAARHHDTRLRSLTLTNCDTHDNVPPEAFEPTVELAKAGALAPSAPALLSDLAAARAAIFGVGYEDPEYLSLDDVRGFLEPLLGTSERAREFERMLSALEPSELLAVE